MIRLETAATPPALVELAALADTIWRECYAELLPAGQIDRMLAEGYDPTRLAAERNAGTVFRLARDADGRAWAYSGLSPNAADPARAWLDKLYVHAKVRGTGLGRRLFEQAITDARALGAQRLELRVNRGNTHALAAYQRLGLAIEYADDKPIGGGYTMDDYVMGLNLAKQSASKRE